MEEFFDSSFFSVFAIFCWALFFFLIYLFNKKYRLSVGQSVVLSLGYFAATLMWPLSVSIGMLMFDGDADSLEGTIAWIFCIIYYVIAVIYIAIVANKAQKKMKRGVSPLHWFSWAYIPTPFVLLLIALLEIGAMWLISKMIVDTYIKVVGV